MALAIDVAMGLAHLVNANGLPVVNRSFGFLDLGAEHNLPTWWSSMKLFTIGALFAVLVLAQRRWSREFFVLAAVACVFAGLSLDEFAAIHEYFGRRTRLDALPVTGLWPFLFGGVGLTATGVLAVVGRPLWRRDAQAAVCLAGGITAFVIAAAGMDLIVNVAPEDSSFVDAASFVEEMIEMLATSVILLGAWRLSLPVATGRGLPSKAART